MSNSPTDNPLRESEVELQDKAKDEVSKDAPKKVAKKKKYFPGFKPYEERGCTDCLCCFLFILFLSGWFGLLVFAFIKGRPEVLYRATDYKGNVCGQYLQTDNTFDNGKAPYDTITELDVGVMPRLVDDLISSSYRQTMSLPVITTQCAKKCPKQGEVFCSYEFLQRMDSEVGGKGVWRSNPISDVEALTFVQRNMGYTSELSRFEVAVTGDAGQAQLQAKCRQATAVSNVFG